MPASGHISSDNKFRFHFGGQKSFIQPMMRPESSGPTVILAKPREEMLQLAGELGCHARQDYGQGAR